MKDLKEDIKNDLSFDNRVFYYILLFFSVISLSIFLSLFVDFFIWVTLALSLIYVLWAPGGKKFYILVFILPVNAAFFYVGADNNPFNLEHIICTFAVFMFSLDYGIKILKKKEKPRYWIFALCSLLALIFMIPFTGIGFEYGRTVAVFLVPFAYLYRNDLNLKEIFYVLFLGCFISLTFGLFVDGSMASKVIWDHHEWRRNGLVVDSNFFANIAIITTAVLLVLYRQRKITTMFYLYFAILTIMVITSVSQGGYLIFAILIVLYGVDSIIRAITRKKKQVKKICIHGLLMIMVVASVVLIYSDGFNRATNRIGDSINIDNNMDRVTTGRWSLWISTIEGVFAQPINAIFGFSPSQEYLSIRYDGVEAMSPHNSYINVLVWGGVLGFLLTLILLGALIKVALKNRAIVWKNYFAVLVCLMVFATVSPLTISSLIVKSMIVAMCMLEKEKEKENESKEVINSSPNLQC